MSRATVVYVLTLAVCITGVFVIVEHGLKLTAPPDLSGEWHVTGSDDALGKKLLVQQSGQFMHLSFDRGQQLDVKLMSEPVRNPQPTTRRAVEMRFAGHGWSLTALGAEGPLVCRLNGPENQEHAFTLTRAAAVAVAVDPHTLADADAP